MPSQTEPVQSNLPPPPEDGQTFLWRIRSSLQTNRDLRYVEPAEPIGITRGDLTRLCEMAEAAWAIHQSIEQVARR